MDDSILRLRRSVRAFKNDDVDNELIKKIISASCQSPSARNQQPWSFVVVKNKKMLNDLASVSKYSAFLANVPALIAIVEKAPSSLTTPDMASIDLSCCASYIMLEATSLGLGSCFMGIWPRRDRIEACNKALELNDDLNTFALIPLGYPLDQNSFYEKNDRFNDDLIRWEE